jgi:hypothetical protein
MVEAYRRPAGGVGEPPQGQADLARLVTRLQALSDDPAKAAACRELLAKLRPHLAASTGPTTSGCASGQ